MAFPILKKASEKLAARTGFRLVAVPGLVPDDVFFEHLAKPPVHSDGLAARSRKRSIIWWNPISSMTFSDMCLCWPIPSLLIF